jgi:hypothetical protein
MTRRTPYTAIGIKRAKCCKCGVPGFAEWRVCADGVYRVVCREHDLELNKIGLNWLHPPQEAARKVRVYIERQNLEDAL